MRQEPDEDEEDDEDEGDRKEEDGDEGTDDGYSQQPAGRDQSSEGTPMDLRLSPSLAWGLVLNLVA